MFSSRVVRARARALSNSLTRGGFFFLFFFLFLLLEDFLATNSNFKARMGLSHVKGHKSSTKRPPNTSISLQTLGKQNTLQKIFLVLAQTHTKTRTSHSTPSRVIECIYIHTHEHKHKHAKTHVHSRVRTNALKS